MITSFNKMPWVIRDSKSIRMMHLHKDALKMCKIARRFADEEIESKMDKLKSLVSKAIEWLRNKGRIIFQANPLLTNILKSLITLKSAIQIWSGALNVGHAVVRASVFAKAAREYNLSVSQFLSQIPPEARPLSILLKGIKLLLISILKILAVREISKMQSEKIHDAGVKGMKKGEHRMAHDPDYVASLKGGGGGSNGSSKSSQPVSVKKAAAIGAGLGAGYAALGTGINAALGQFKGLKKSNVAAGVGLAAGLTSAAGAGAGALGANIYNRLSRKNKDSLITITHMPWAFKADAGVKGMKKGQHIKAKDPDYVESLKGGGGASGGSASPNQPQKQGMSTGKKIAIGLGALAGGAALAFGGHKLMKLAGAKKAAQKALPSAAQKVSSAAAPAAKAISSASSNVKNVTTQGKNIAKKLGGSAAARNVGGVHAQRAAMAKARQIASTASNSAGTHTGVINRMANSTKNMQRALANPKHVFDI